MADESEKLLFRMQHIIPRNLSAMKKLKETPATSTNVPQEIEVQMTWGKIAGGLYIYYYYIIILPRVLLFTEQLKFGDH